MADEAKKDAGSSMLARGTKAPVVTRRRSKDKIGYLSFQVSPEFHKEFKIAAAANDMSMKELLEACYLAWLDQNGKKRKSQ